MTLQRTVNITRERQVHLDLPVPKNIPVGKAKVRVVFVSYSSPKSNKKKNTQALCGMFANTGDTVDKFMERKRLENKKKSAFGCLNEYADVSKISLEKGAWENEVAKKYAIN